MKSVSDLIRPKAVLAVIASGAALLLVSGCDTQKTESSVMAPATQPVTTTVTTTVTTSVGTEIDDGVVTTKVKSALLADPDIKSFDLKVETRKGEVMLSGFVGNLAQAERAIVVARGVEGVKDVTNRMDLKDGAATVGNTVDDGIITTKIKAALLTDPNIKSLDIAVVTRKGEAQLSGFVNNQNQIDRATELARAVDGVRAVASEMSIKK